MFKKGKRNIINKIIEENLDYLFRFAFYRIGNREEAEDIVYESILKFLEKNLMEINPGSVRLYLFRIVHNLCVDKRRTHGACRVLIEEIDIEDETFEIHENDDYERINTYLNKIEPREADIIRMNIIDGLSFVDALKKLCI